LRSPEAVSSSSSRPIGDAHLAQVADVEVVALAGGLELLLLLEFGDRGAIHALRAAAWSAVAGSVALIALVGAGSGHLVRVTCG
jgi:hypothetical protein